MWKRRILRFQGYKNLCVSCSKKGKNHPMFGKPLSDEHKQKLSIANTGENNPMYGIRNFGKDNPHWNPNLTDEDREMGRRYPEYYMWRKAVFKRDNYTCQICGQVGGSLNAHHLEGYTNNLKLRITLSNGVIMCKKCHDNFHHQYGYNNTKEQYKEYREYYGKHN